jgi:Flp pilus assembly protein TadB
MGRTDRRRPEQTDALHIPTSKQKSAEDFDIIIGFLGFWAVVLFAVTLWLELTGQPALMWALGLLLVCLGLWGMIRLRRKLPARRGRRPQ